MRIANRTDERTNHFLRFTLDTINVVLYRSKIPILFETAALQKSENDPTFKVWRFKP